MEGQRGQKFKVQEFKVQEFKSSKFKGRFPAFGLSGFLTFFVLSVRPATTLLELRATNLPSRVLQPVAYHLFIPQTGIGNQYGLSGLCSYQTILLLFSGPHC